MTLSKIVLATTAERSICLSSRAASSPREESKKRSRDWKEGGGRGKDRGTRGRRPRAAKFSSVPLLVSTSHQAPIYRSLEMSTHRKFLLDRPNFCAPLRESDLEWVKIQATDLPYEISRIKKFSVQILHRVYTPLLSNRVILSLEKELLLNSKA